MKLYKGTLNHYLATGENEHLYLWIGDAKSKFHDWNNHIIISETEILQYTNPKTKKSYVIHWMPANFRDLEQFDKKEYKTFLKAVANNWPAELVKFED